jgi:hypothetical protein
MSNLVDREDLQRADRWAALEHDDYGKLPSIAHGFFTTGAFTVDLPSGERAVVTARCVHLAEGCGTGSYWVIHLRDEPCLMLEWSDEDSAHHLDHCGCFAELACLGVPQALIEEARTKLRQLMRSEPR